MAGSERNQSALVRFEQLELEIKRVQQAVALNFGRWQIFLKGSVCKTAREVDVLEVRDIREPVQECKTQNQPEELWMLDSLGCCYGGLVYPLPPCRHVTTAFVFKRLMQIGLCLAFALCS